MKYRVLLGAVVGIVAALGWGSARAQMFSAPSGPGAWYLGGEGGWTALEDQTVTGGLNAKVQSNDGFNFGMRGGYIWGPWRFEEELRWQRNGLSKVGSLGVNGATNAYAIMTNAIYDFNIGSMFSPHLGAGIGAVGLNSDVTVGPAEVHGTDWEFGYQAIAGVRYMVNPALAFDLDYRYLATTDARFTATAGGASVGLKSGYDSHSLVASLSMIFGAPPPPPPPVAAPVASPAPPPSARKVFLVFFDWDRDAITPQGLQIIHQAADAYRAGMPVRVQVTGYTDRSGSTGYNLRLSQRRANNVANALARFGVPRNEMSVTGRGENDNRVPTANGVREPQNRRVEIVFP